MYYKLWGISSFFKYLINDIIIIIIIIIIIDAFTPCI